MTSTSDAIISYLEETLHSSVYSVCSQDYNLAEAGKANAYIVLGKHFWYRDTTDLTFKTRDHILHKRSNYVAKYLPDKAEDRRDSIANAISSPDFIGSNSGVYHLVRLRWCLTVCLWR